MRRAREAESRGAPSWAAVWVGLEREQRRPARRCAYGPAARVFDDSVRDVSV